MTKTDLVKKMAVSAEISQSSADKCLKSLLGDIQATLAKKEKVTLVGFGTFSTKFRKARAGRNPQTGKSIEIAEKHVAFFTPGAKLKEACK